MSRVETIPEDPSSEKTEEFPSAAAFATHHQRDFLAISLGQLSMQHYFGVAQNQSLARTRLNLLHKLHSLPRD
ncbi:MAG: hypothetical protein Q8P67_23920 [archaeon]|nr:hypothetical protein [archaeon]